MNTPYSIVVADDHPDAADSLAILLRRAGHHVRVAYDGDDALAALLDERPDIAILDIDMPGHDGLDVARMARARLACGRTVFIALTSHGSAAIRHETRSAGFHLHLQKPLRIAQLAPLLDGLFAPRGQPLEDAA